MTLPIRSQGKLEDVISPLGSLSSAATLTQHQRSSGLAAPVLASMKKPVVLFMQSC